MCTNLRATFQNSKPPLCPPSLPTPFPFHLFGSMKSWEAGKPCGCISFPFNLLFSSLLYWTSSPHHEIVHILWSLLRHLLLETKSTSYICLVQKSSIKLVVVISLVIINIVSCPSINEENWVVLTKNSLRNRYVSNGWFKKLDRKIEMLILICTILQNFSCTISSVIIFYLFNIFIIVFDISLKLFF